MPVDTRRATPGAPEQYHSGAPGVRVQILRGQAIPWVFTLIVALVVALGVARQQALNGEAASRQRELTQLEVVFADVINLETGERGFLITGQESFLTPYLRSGAKINSDLNDLQASAFQHGEDLAAERKIIDSVRQSVGVWRAETAEPGIAARRAGRATSNTYEASGRGKAVVDEVRRQLEAYRDAEGARVLAARTQAGAALTFVQFSTIIGLTLAALISAMASLLVAGSLGHDLNQLAKAARRTEAGEPSDSPLEGSASETIALAHALNAMTTRLQAAQQALAERNESLSRQADALAYAGRSEHTLAKTLRFFATEHDRCSIMEAVLQRLADAHGFLDSVAYTVEDESGKLVTVAARGGDPALGRALGARASLVARSLQDRELVVIQDGPTPVVLETALRSAPTSFTTIVPVCYQERGLGALVLSSMSSPDEATLRFLERLGQQVGIGLQNLDQYRNLQDLSVRLRERGREIEDKNRDLERADRLKSEFLANMSHELRTPLNAVIGYSELLQDGFYGSLTAKQGEYVTEIMNAGEHLLALINDILDLSKIEAGRLVLEPEDLELRPVLEDCLTLVRERALNRGLNLTLDVPDGVKLRADERKLKQIVVNLLSNAVKFTNAGGSVIVRGKRVLGGVTVSVTDTGIGISEEGQSMLFQPFTQVDGSLSRHHEGTGLGLALTKRLAMLHGGSVSVRSLFGEGSTFTVALPGSTEPAVVASTAIVPCEAQATRVPSSKDGGAAAPNATSGTVT